MARPVWRRGDQLGVAFLPEDGPKSAESDLAKDDKFRALEAQVAVLRTEIGILKNDLYRRDEEAPEANVVRRARLSASGALHWLGRQPGPAPAPRRKHPSRRSRRHWR